MDCLYTNFMQNGVTCSLRPLYFRVECSRAPAAARSTAWPEQVGEMDKVVVYPRHKDLVALLSTVNVHIIKLEKSYKTCLRERADTSGCPDVRFHKVAC